MAEQGRDVLMAAPLRILETRYVDGEIDGEFSASFQVRTTNGLHGAEFPINPDLTCDRKDAARALRALAASLTHDPLDSSALFRIDDQDASEVISEAWIDEAEELAANAASVTIPGEEFGKLLVAARNGLRRKSVNGSADE